uniref:Uncharacterized protein n=1 Tax=Oryza punctata TaxID=4537 RepID=A0A0E0M800_ORYPU
MGSHIGGSIAFHMALAMVDEGIELREALDKGSVTVEANLDGEDHPVEFIAQVTDLAYGWREVVEVEEEEEK